MIKPHDSKKPQHSRVQKNPALELNLRFLTTPIIHIKIVSNWDQLEAHPQNQ